MKKLLYILLLTTVKGYSQADLPLIGKDTTTGMPGFIYKLPQTQIAHPLYKSGNTILFDTSRYYVQSFALNGTGDSIVLTFAGGMRLALKVSGVPAGLTNQVQYNNDGVFGADSGFRYSQTGVNLTSGANKHYAGLYLQPTLTSTSNSDTLVGFEISPKYVLGSFTTTPKRTVKIFNSFMNFDSLYNWSWGSTMAAQPTAGNTIFFGNSAGSGATNAGNSIFGGPSAGNAATNASTSIFLGNGAGNGATNASTSIFLGWLAGQSATGASGSIFMGERAGNGGTNAPRAVMLGYRAGFTTPNASNSVLIGSQAGTANTGLSYSNLIGYNVGANSGGSNNLTGARLNLMGYNIGPPSNSSSDLFDFGNVLYISNPNSNTNGGVPVYTPMVDGRLGINNGTPDTSSVLDITGYKYGILIPRHTTASRQSITTGIKAGTLNGAAGSGYTNGTYTDQALTTVSGIGTGARATIVVISNSVNSVTITAPGYNYAILDTLTWTGGGGSGLSYRVTELQHGSRGLLLYDSSENQIAKLNLDSTWSGFNTSSASTLTLKFANDYVFSGTTATYTLPPINSSILGRQNGIKIKNRGSGSITLNSASGSTIYSTSAVTTITIAAGAACELMPDGTYFNVMFNQ